ncbi:MAG TPA: Xaa-Pro aminopeptidase [Bacillota bacterium]|nr:Xaa-Pro aminopeptidase [Bacillota bacterium]HPF42659.1 Xaa-Pro aminopeptidase [Bacillota bacterium]HPJ85518.1 Xaa-Pro aminopeptidase [Bacillota bacterium]HPQ62092.1 Xaa-Pro aminopeptidase [Bacillota bacterium]HRX92444.1 Xaa-Pro aminopeptidase [Candidatus Izemoplasmatales bacterium]
MDRAFYKKHREDFLARMDSQSFMVLFSGKAPHKSADQKYQYTPNRNFFYMTGIGRENMILLLIKGKSVGHEYLFIEEPSDYMTKWYGPRMSKEEAANISGIDSGSIRYKGEFSGFLAQSVLTDSRKNLAGSIKIAYFDMYRSEPLAKPVNHPYFETIIDNYPELEIKNACEIIDLLRMVKDESEIAEIEKAIAYTKKGLDAIFKTVRPGVNERELEAVFAYEIRRQGSEGISFDTIVASGMNATSLHYEDNNCQINGGDLVLTDLGALSGPYAADITRTFPASREFTTRQKKIYELVLSVNKACIAKVHPGLVMADLFSFARDELARGLIRLGVMRDMSEIDKYYYHSVSHYLGLDVHDVGTYQLPLVPGVVLTIEPGVYIEEEGIGIRIEDDVLVTAKGSRNLSESIPKEIAEIERLLAK